MIADQEHVGTGAREQAAFFADVERIPEELLRLVKVSAQDVLEEGTRPQGARGALAEPRVRRRQIESLDLNVVTESAGGVGKLADVEERAVVGSEIVVVGDLHAWATPRSKKVSPL